MLSPNITGARSTQEEVIQCTVPPKQVCHGLSGRKVDYTIHVSWMHVACALAIDQAIAGIVKGGPIYCEAYPTTNYN